MTREVGLLIPSLPAGRPAREACGVALLALLALLCLATSPWSGGALAGGRDPFHEGLCPKWASPGEGGRGHRVPPGGGFGFIDYTGQWVIPPTLPGANPFSSGIAEIGSGPARGDRSQRYYINYNGDRVDDELVQRIKAGLQKVQKNGKWGFADPKTGELVIEATYDEVWDFSEGLALVRIEGASPPYRWIDYTGREVIVLPGVQRAASFHEGLAPVRTEVVSRGSGGDLPAIKSGFIDRRGRFVIEPKFDFVAEFSEGRARVQNDGKWGFIDYTGKIVIPAKFESGEDFSEGLAAVRVGGEVNAYGFVDSSGKFVIPPNYREVRSFSHGMAYVDDGDFRGFIDHAGNVVIKAQIEVFGGF
jgi:hypothetical protein